jgi:hypothetical protein
MNSLLIPSLASYLQYLKAPPVRAEVMEAVAEKDMKAFEDACLKAKIPRQFIRRMTRIVFSVQPDQIWPPLLWW